MKHIILALLFSATLSAAPQYTIRDGVVAYLSTAANPKAPTKAEADALRAEIAADEQAAAAKEATRLTKRPKRSQINSAMAATADAQTVPELRAAVAELMVLLNNVLSYQKVDIEEDE